MNDPTPTDATRLPVSGRDSFDSEKIEHLFSICSPVQAGALGLLAQATSLGVPPAPFLESFARELKDFDRIRVQKLANDCGQSQPLIETIESGGRFFPPPVILAMRLAHDSNTLEELCESIANRPTYTPAVKGLSEQTPLQRIMSITWKILIVLWITTFVMLFVIPQFNQMFEEFGLELPEMTLLLIKVSSLFCQYWFILFVLIAFVAFWYRREFFYHVLRAFSPTRWNQTRHSPAVQAKFNLAWLFESEVDFSEGLKQLARFEPNKRMSAKIQQAITRTEAGQAPSKALGIAGVISDREARAIETASSPETRSWLLRQMATAQASRLDSWSTTRVRLFTTLINVVLGLFVLLMCVGLFAPLINLIRSLTP